MRRAGVAAATAAVLAALGWLSFNACALAVTSGMRLWEQWVTRQGISPDKRAQMRDDDRFDWVDMDSRSKQ